LNGNGTFEATMCDDASCSGGDAFYGVQVGCNAGSYDFCKSTHGDWVKVDTSATGSYPTPMNTGGKNVNYLTIKDIEFRSYNGGHASGSTGVRAREGIIALAGQSRELLGQLLRLPQRQLLGLHGDQEQPLVPEQREDRRRRLRRRRE
jgi:hypothetical protein